MNKLYQLSVLILLACACNPDNELTIIVAPDNLSAIASDEETIVLNWSDNSENESGFNIYRKPILDSAFVRVAEVSANISEYIDTSIETDVEYAYRISAWNEAGESEFSNSASIKVLFDAFKDLPEWTSIPDANFENSLIELGYDDTFDRQVLTANISRIDTLILEHKRISDISGIESFVSLLYLSLWDNDFTQIDVSNLRQLRILGLSECPIATIDLSKNRKLIEIDFQHNSDRINDPEYPFGKTLGFTELDLSNNVNMERVYLIANRLTELDVSNCPKLTNLWIGATKRDSDTTDFKANNIKVLDLTNNPELNVLVADNCNLEYLNIKGTANNGVPRTCITKGNPNLFEIIVDDVERIEQYRNSDPNGNGTLVSEAWYKKDDHTKYVEK